MNKLSKSRWITVLIVYLSVIGINFVLSYISIKLGIPPILGIAGSMTIAIMGGYFPGVWVVLLTHILTSYFIKEFLDYSIINILIIICTAYFSQKGYFKRKSKIFVYIIMTSAIVSAISSLIVAEADRFGDNTIYSNPFFDNYLEDPLSLLLISLLFFFIMSVLSQCICLFIAFTIIKFVPENIKRNIYEFGWLQKVLNNDEIERLNNTKTRTITTKMVFIIALITTCLIVLMVVATIGSNLFIVYTKQENEELVENASKMVSKMIDGDKIDDYVATGGQGEEYEKIVSELENIRRVSDNIKFIYVYKIKPDGCHVVFDLDTEDVIAADPGEIVGFDKSFEQFVPTLLEGGTIEPFVSDDNYGWLLTSYSPIYNSKGETVCYAGVDISMEYLSLYRRQFLIRLLILCSGIIIVIIVTGLWVAKYRIIYPVNSMVERARFFSYDNEAARKDNVKLLEDLEIHTGDEIERLYHSFLQITKDSMKSFSKMQQKSDYIEKVQASLIVILADMVENRDESTGDHIKKTSNYTLIIMRNMKKLGIHTDVLTDEFMDNVYKSAPLHDIGKIKIPDAILNKPGKLTPEEFEIMKLHSVYGGEIISKLVESLTQASYLEVARDIALYHHEKWNGLGYPKKLKGEEIPLSARIMAVADVFDALISDRVYKKAFSFEKAIDIIQQESGTHFDPDIVRAFMLSLDEVRETAKMQNKTKSD